MALTTTTEQDFAQAISTATVTAREALARVWDDTGLDAAGRTDALQLLQQRLLKILEGTVQEHQEANTKLRREVAELAMQHADSRACLAALDEATEAEYRASFHLATDGLPLLLQRQRLTDAVAALRRLCNARQASFARQHADLLDLYNALGTPLLDRKDFAQSTSFMGSDVSHTLLRAYQLEIAACRAQKRAHNLQRIRSLAAEVAALGLELDRPAEVEAHGSVLLDMAKDAELEERVRTLEQQLSQLKAESQQRISVQLVETSERLQQLWRQYHDLTGHSLAGPVTEEVSEEALRDLQSRVAEAQARVTEVGEAMGMLRRRDAILADEAEMLAAQNDPSRLMSKRQGMAQQLLREERTRRAVRTELPKLNAQLRRFAAEWPQRHGGEAFLYRGQALLELLPAEAPPALPPAALGGAVRPTEPAQMASPALGKRKADRSPLSPIAKRQNCSLRSASACPVLRPTTPSRSGSTFSLRPTASTRSDSMSSVYSKCSLKSTASQPLPRTSPLVAVATPTKPDRRVVPRGTPSRIPAPPAFKAPSSLPTPRKPATPIRL